MEGSFFMDQKPQFEKRRSLIDTNPKPLKCSLINTDAIPSSKSEMEKQPKLRQKRPLHLVLASVLAVGSLATFSTLYFGFASEDNNQTAYQKSENAASADASSNFVPTEDALPNDYLASNNNQEATFQLTTIHQNTNQTAEPTPVKNNDSNNGAPGKESTPKPNPAPEQPDPKDPQEEITEPTDGETKSTAPEWKSTMIYRPGDRVSFGGEEYQAVAVNINERPDLSSAWVKVEPGN